MFVSSVNVKKNSLSAADLVTQKASIKHEDVITCKSFPRYCSLWRKPPVTSAFLVPSYSKCKQTGRKPRKQRPDKLAGIIWSQALEICLTASSLCFRGILLVKHALNTGDVQHYLCAANMQNFGLVIVGTTLAKRQRIQPTYGRYSWGY